jgi:hypothetical protein
MDLKSDSATKADAAAGAETQIISPQRLPDSREDVGGRISVVPDVPGVDLKPDPMAARNGGEFVNLMHQLRIWVGNPSLRTLAAKAKGEFAASTLSGALNSVELPSYKLAITFVRACGCTEEEVARWATSWRSIALGEHAAGGRQVETSITKAARLLDDNERAFRRVHRPWFG